MPALLQLPPFFFYFMAGFHITLCLYRHQVVVTFPFRQIPSQSAFSPPFQSHPQFLLILYVKDCLLNVEWVFQGCALAFSATSLPVCWWNCGMCKSGRPWVCVLLSVSSPPWVVRIWGYADVTSVHLHLLLPDHLCILFFVLQQSFISVFKIFHSVSVVVRISYTLILILQLYPT